MTQQRNTGDAHESYTPDDFDNPPAGPVGVHRGSRSLAIRLIPYVVVLVVAALMGLLAWGLFSGSINNLKLPWSSADSSQSSSTAASSAASSSAAESSSSSAESSSSASDDASSSASSEPSDSESASASASESSSAAQSVNKATSIRVINGTGTSGYAARKKTVLTQAGYSNVVAGNPSGTLPSSSVVWYQNETDKATAENVASSLGISAVSQASSISAPVVVVLMN
ncbi:LytR C-terminal domain-containing protein [Bifidobacterium crudilactis]|jgi:cytoskeletal protein RodZ|uniref:LytR C-terminal domain-containing protein n=1 Tax=Bifidobacterium crudilactis TaxID=327277 RepID=A0A971D0I1_9BIFI|nr:LytR C-terminal domain-containing protein [Bifidobacterium crudilactis]MCI1663956.1 LytR C-terminal domain-containing protein [Bifidobacterium crudilactis]MCI1868067.1 LytR C-terminal domain-containing protein [Bifidobacterium crudilactis]MDN5971517.1 LytR C-terminal domain-containing protein [Bifidobacterium crudilactis]MDN6000867.1 LytR C-terminal domain-containing protein [Bifidobacterium crudilactis]MDN6209229.1 LytR C-terminal domain-containing protein [Bifidobacterium crudilactis]